MSTPPKTFGMSLRVRHPTDTSPHPDNVARLRFFLPWPLSFDRIAESEMTNEPF